MEEGTSGLEDGPLLVRRCAAGALRQSGGVRLRQIFLQTCSEGGAEAALAALAESFSIGCTEIVTSQVLIQTFLEDQIRAWFVTSIFPCLAPFDWLKLRIASTFFDRVSSK